MRARVLTIIILIVLAIGVKAQENYQVSMSGKQRIVTGSIEYSKGDREIFANAVMWAIEQGNEFKELITDCDFNKLRLVVANNIAEEGQTSFTSTLTIQVSQGRMVYLINNIKGLGGGLFGVLGSTISDFDKMNPEKKPKQQTMIDEFEKVNAKVLKQLFEFVREHNVDTSKWNCFAEDRLEKGMSVDEVKMVLGKPMNIQKVGDTTQYMYGAFTYVFFENGKVTSFIK